MVEVIYQKRFLARGPRVVAIGGGTGPLDAAARPQGAHAQPDGGRDRRRRRRLVGHAPRPSSGSRAVGDIRNCIVALADAEPLMGRLLQYRFPGAGRDPDVDAARGPGPDPRRRRRARRPRRRQPAARGAGRSSRTATSRRRVRRDEPRARGPRPGRAGDRRRRGHAAARARRRHRGRRPVADRRTTGVDRVWVTPDGRPADRGRARGHRRRRAHRHRPGQPVHEPPARASWCPGSARRRGVRRPGRVRVQRGDAARRDGRVRPRGPRRGARSPRRRPTCRTSCSPTTGSTRTRRAGGGPAGGAALAADDEPGAAARPRRPRRPRERPPPRPGPPRGRRHPARWEREGGHRRRPRAARADRTA